MYEKKIKLSGFSDWTPAKCCAAAPRTGAAAKAAINEAQPTSTPGRRDRSMSPAVLGLRQLSTSMSNASIHSNYSDDSLCSGGGGGAGDARYNNAQCGQCQSHWVGRNYHPTPPTQHNNSVRWNHLHYEFSECFYILFEFQNLNFKISI